MKRIAFFLALALCSPLAAHADDASRHAKAKEMLALLHMDKLMAQIEQSAQSQLTTMTNKLSPTPENKPKFDAFQAGIDKLVQEQLSWTKVEPDYIDLYAKAFTDEEFDSILAFYKSPGGVALIEKMPPVTQQGMQLAQTKMAALQPQLKQMLEDYQKSIQQPVTLPPSPPK